MSSVNRNFRTNIELHSMSEAMQKSLNRELFAFLCILTQDRHWTIVLQSE